MRITRPLNKNDYQTYYAMDEMIFEGKYMGRPFEMIFNVDSGLIEFSPPYPSDIDRKIIKKEIIRLERLF